MAEKSSASSVKPKRAPLKPGPDGIVRLSGGNPQIAKGEGDEIVQSYIKAMEDWKSGIGRQMDAIIGDVVPDAFKLVKWNTPFYGTDPKSWFVSFHCMTKYIKVAFPDGTALDPQPPGKSKQQSVRYYDIYENEFDADQFRDWVKQASQLPGENFG